MHTDQCTGEFVTVCLCSQVLYPDYALALDFLSLLSCKSVVTRITNKECVQKKWKSLTTRDIAPLFAPTSLLSLLSMKALLSLALV